MSYMLIAFVLVFGVLYIRKKVPAQLLLLASGFLLFFLSVSALSQILVGKVQIKTVATPFAGLLGLLLERGLVHVFSYFGSILLSSVLFLISLFLIVQVPFLSMIETRMTRKRSVEEERPKPVRVVEEKPIEPAREKEREKEKERKERKAVQESFDFLKEIGP